MRTGVIAALAALCGATFLCAAPNSAQATLMACSAPTGTGSVVGANGNDCQLVAGASTITAVLVYSSAGYQNTLKLPSAGGGVIFQNNSAAYPVGSVAKLTVTPGQLLDFTLSNSSGTFTAGDNSTDGVYHAVYRSYANVGDLSIPALDPSVLSALNANGGASSFTFVGFEDMMGGGDRDYNDLVLAFASVLPADPGGSPVGVPEPSSLFLLAGSLCGIAAVRSKRRKGDSA